MWIEGHNKEILTFYFFTLIDKNLVCYSYLESPVYMPFVQISEPFFIMHKVVNIFLPI